MQVIEIRRADKQLPIRSLQFAARHRKIKPLSRGENLPDLRSQEGETV
jgi:hypothetical protein